MTTVTGLSKYTKEIVKKSTILMGTLPEGQTIEMKQIPLSALLP